MHLPVLSLLPVHLVPVCGISILQPLLIREQRRLALLGVLAVGMAGSVAAGHFFVTRAARQAQEGVGCVAGRFIGFLDRQIHRRPLGFALSYPKIGLAGGVHGHLAPPLFFKTSTLDISRPLINMGGSAVNSPELIALLPTGSRELQKAAILIESRETKKKKQLASY